VKLSALRERLESRSSKLSELLRQFSFGGLALVWLFRTGEGTSAKFPTSLSRAALFFVIALAIDATHYTYAYWMLRKQHRQFEIAEYSKPVPDPDPEVMLNPRVNRPTDMLFIGKLVSVAAGFGCLLFFLYSRSF
jgi:hypothetical protein